MYRREKGAGKAQMGETLSHHKMVKANLKENPFSEDSAKIQKNPGEKRSPGIGHQFSGMIICAGILWMILWLFLVGCGGQKVDTETLRIPSLNDVPDKTWEKLAQKRIFFGHQSVGCNIIEGVNKIMSTHSAVRLKVVETADCKVFDQPIFAHAEVGNNGDPESKIRAFKEYMKSGIGGKVDIAFFKLCFWDIRKDTDIQLVFNKYEETLRELKVQFPSVVFAHMTVPLVSYSDRIVVRIYRSLGRPVNSDMDNIKRNELNKLILKEFSGTEPVIDLAQAESVFPNGERTFFMQNKNRYYVLASAYTSDGGHLNEKGQVWVAEHFLITLAKVAEGL